MKTGQPFKILDQDWSWRMQTATMTTWTAMETRSLRQRYRLNSQTVIIGSRTLPNQVGTLMVMAGTTFTQTEQWLLVLKRLTVRVTPLIQIQVSWFQSMVLQQTVNGLLTVTGNTLTLQRASKRRINMYGLETLLRKSTTMETAIWFMANKWSTVTGNTSIQ